jgi:hypothetical protein
VVEYLPRNIRCNNGVVAAQLKEQMSGSEHVTLASERSHGREVDGKGDGRGRNS